MQLFKNGLLGAVGVLALAASVVVGTGLLSAGAGRSSVHLPLLMRNAGVGEAAAAIPASNLVALESIGTAGGRDFQRVLPDGTGGPCTPSGCFRVPAGLVLVVTDVDWQYNAGSPGQVQTLRLFIEPLAEPGSRGYRAAESTTVLNAAGQGGTSLNMTTGFAMSSKARLLVDVSPGGGTISHVVVRGYLLAE